MVCLRGLVVSWLCAVSAASSSKISSGGGGGGSGMVSGTTAAVAGASASAAGVVASSEATAASSEWNSSPFKLQSIADNSLGLLARNCAGAYCGAHISGLDLWIHFEQVCLVKVSETTSLQQNDTEAPPRPVETWSDLSAVLLCLIVAGACLVLGFRVGSTYASYSSMRKGTFILAPA